VKRKNTTQEQPHIPYLPSVPQANSASELRQRAEKMFQEKSILIDKLPSNDLYHLVHELSVHQIELELQNEELQQTRHELEARLEFIDLFDFAPVGYFTMGQNGTILQMNFTGERLLNEERSHIVGVRFGLFVSESDRSAFNEFLKQVFSSRIIQSCEVAIQRKNDEPLWVYIEGIAAKDGQECRVTMHDITIRRKMEEKLLHINMRLEQRVRERTVELQQANRALVKAQETERRALALELHDELGQVLNRVKLSLDLIPMLESEAGQKQLILASELVRDMINRVRHISLDLRPSMLDDMGLLPTLHWLFGNYESQSGEKVSFTHTGIAQRFPPEVEITAYRIIQEALSNVTRHAVNKAVRVELRADEQTLYIQICDQGGGFDLETA
jgi:PAS domain S-box-containing protein